MDKLHTDPGLTSLVLDGIMSVFEDSQMDPNSYSEQYREIVTQQNLIGWNNFFKGRWTKEWAVTQEAHLKQTGKFSAKCSGITWVTNLIDTMWKDWLEM